MNSQKYTNQATQEPKFVDIENGNFTNWFFQVCNLCLPERELEPIGSVSRYPYKSKKKPPAIQHTAVLLLEKKSSTSESTFLVFKAPKKGLLANLWDFPNVIIPNNNDTQENEQECNQEEQKVDEKQVKLMRNQFMLETASIDLTKLTGKRTHIGSLLHVFSHIKRTMHIEHLVVTDERELEMLQNISLSKDTSLQDAKWSTEADLMSDSSDSPTTLSKVFEFVKKGKKESKKRKAEPEKPKDGLKQKGIQDFFKRK